MPVYHEKCVLAVPPAPRAPCLTCSLPLVLPAPHAPCSSCSLPLVPRLSCSLPLVLPVPFLACIQHTTARIIRCDCLVPKSDERHDPTDLLPAVTAVVPKYRSVMSDTSLTDQTVPSTCTCKSLGSGVHARRRARTTCTVMQGRGAQGSMITLCMHACAACLVFRCACTAPPGPVFSSPSQSFEDAQAVEAPKLRWLLPPHWCVRAKGITRWNRSGRYSPAPQQPSPTWPALAH